MRDLLVGITPKDFDIVTMARPEQVQKIIRPSFIIGRRFRLVLVRRYNQQYEISTFRSLTYSQEATPDTIDENIYGEPPEDALRRDFTINGLFYDPLNQEVIDHTQGLADIEQRILRMIGDPTERIEQDPIRILRALRLSHRIGFRIEPGMRQAMSQKAHLLTTAVLPRVREEIIKILRLPKPHLTLLEGYDLGIIAAISPRLAALLDNNEKTHDFVNILNTGLSAIGSDVEAGELYSMLLYAYLSSEDPEWNTHLKTRFDDAFLEFLKTELGMHRNEFELFEQTINLLKQLIKYGDPFKLRARHREHVITNRAFPMAMILATRFHHLDPSLVAGWIKVVRKEKV